jgi:hypothetical protein
VNPCFETIFLVEPPRHFEHGCGVETEPTVQIEYGDYAWVRDTASASLVRHFPEPRCDVNAALPLGLHIM